MNIVTEYQYFAPVTLYSYVAKFQNIQFEQCENFQKSSFRNKMQLASPQGVLNLSIPILGGRGTRQHINNIVVDYRLPWQRQHFATICNLYNRSAYFEFYKPELNILYNTTIFDLISWNKECHFWVLSKLKLQAIMAATNSYIYNYDNNSHIDLRNQLLTYQGKMALSPKPYTQVFNGGNNFIPNLSILDLLFCQGPNSRAYL